ncbi:hypothetical protein, partial [Brevibacillus panacihumi]|uniref:hypothetical protein n=1 Tax=Brevibacillus panacihumi TaxID=497735 RepID=UPI001C831B5E
NSPIKFVTGSKLANHLMIDSSTLSLFSFQRAFLTSSPRGDFLNLTHISLLNQVFFSFFLLPFVSRSSAATFVTIA